MTRSLLAGAWALAWTLMPVAGAHAQTDTVLVPADDASGGAADLGASSNAALAEDDGQAPVPFENGQLTITQQEDYGEKVLAYDGKQLARNYDVFFDRIVEVGGNQCCPAKVIVWKPEGGTIQTTTVEQDECGAPPAALSDGAIYFVPNLLPGESKPALQWSPTGGLSTSGNLAYMPEPGTGWKDVDPAKYDSIVDAFHNEAVYRQAASLLGKEMPDMATSLLVGGGTEKTTSGVFHASGCIPHDCGGDDGFMAIDPANHKLYFARRGDKPEPGAWPAVNTWPAEVREAMDKALGSPN
ncbi:MAG: hypothetical protein EOS10_17210 [Mesorhizobium sp.]|uniref:hypothetical protein n=1 Tax=Mesorhizobium sp. TaxID=1871066 RepID=UPI000FE93779|nr:hypothetical protein [Mesorhizobium sp.]RWO30872.1 MAG: hypothetical protein EOS10_17210 [Mesorhizobium sp.]